jgi:hypothetical protein
MIATPNRLLHIAKAVLPCSGHGKKNHVLRHRPAVGADALDLASRQSRWNISLRKEFGKPHQ